MKLVIILFSLVLGVEAFEDGAWNGKPRKKEALEKEVAAGKPGALAEWAYSSLHGYSGIRYQPELVKARANQSAEAGNPLGLAVAALYEFENKNPDRDDERTRTMVFVAAEKGHPVALWKKGVMLRYGRFGSKKDTPAGVALLQEAEKAGCVGAYNSLFFVHSKGELGEVDMELAVEYLRRGLTLGDPETINFLYRALKGERAWKRMTSFFSAEEFQQAEKKLIEHAELGVPGNEYIYGFYLIKEGDPHAGLPHLIRSSRSRWFGHSSLIFNSGRRLSSDSNMITLVADYQTESKQAEDAYLAGCTDDDMMLRLAQSYLGDPRKMTPKRKIGLKILNGLVKDSACQNRAACVALGSQLVYTFRMRNDFPREQLERGFALMEYHGDHASPPHWIGISYAHPAKRSVDLPKAIASLNRAIELNGGRWLHFEKITLADVMKRATEEEKKKAKELTADAWPHGKKHRKKAFAKLQKFGDIPADRLFEPKTRPDEVRGAGDL